MSQDHSYNGWKNYETWATALWLDNDEWSYNTAREVVAEARRVAEARGDTEYPDVAAADALKEWAEETFIEPITESGTPYGLAVDLLRAAWSEVDWFEVAAHYVEEGVDA